MTVAPSPGRRVLALQRVHLRESLEEDTEFTEDREPGELMNGETKVAMTEGGARSRRNQMWTQSPGRKRPS